MGGVGSRECDGDLAMFTTPIYEIKGIPEAIKKLGFRMRRLEDFREPLTILKDDFFALQKGWMDSQGRGTWKALRPAYSKWKIKKVGRKPILQLTGDMYADVTGGSPYGTRISRGEATIRAVKSGRRWIQHSQGLSEDNKSGFERPKRRVLSPALNVRRPYWNRLLRNWAAGL